MNDYISFGRKTLAEDKKRHRLYWLAVTTVSFALLSIMCAAGAGKIALLLALLLAAIAQLILVRFSDALFSQADELLARAASQTGAPRTDAFTEVPKGVSLLSGGTDAAKGAATAKGTSAAKGAETAKGTNAAKRTDAAKDAGNTDTAAKGDGGITQGAFVSAPFATGSAQSGQDGAAVSAESTEPGRAGQSAASPSAQGITSSASIQDTTSTGSISQDTASTVSMADTASTVSARSIASTVSASDAASTAPQSDRISSGNAIFKRGLLEYFDLYGS